MFQFSGFPIYVLYSRHSQETAELPWNGYYANLSLARTKAKDDFVNLRIKRLIDELKKINKYSNLIDAIQASHLVEDLKPQYRGEILRFENEIRRILMRISATKIGQIVLSSLNPSEVIWVVPFFGAKNVAMTGRGTESAGSAIRIRYNPEDFASTYEGEGLGKNDVREEVLIHELVHAARQSHNRFNRMPLDTATFGNTEEFVAEQIGNIYRSSTRKINRLGLYHGGYDTKENIYSMFSKDWRIISFIKTLLKTDPIAQRAAALKSPDYNPFRDFHLIERESHKHFIDL